MIVFFFSSRRRHTRCALVTGVQTCALPISTADILGEAHAGELLQPTGPERLLKRVAIRRCDQAIGIHRPDQTPVDRRHPLLANVVAQPRLDFLIGARPDIERPELGPPLAARAAGRSVGKECVMTGWLSWFSRHIIT